MHSRRSTVFSLSPANDTEVYESEAVKEIERTKNNAVIKVLVKSISQT